MLLPAAILALASVLSLEDREVLAYLITRSMKISPSSMIEDKKKCKKPNTHKPPLFHCGCFDCYRSYWFRWDSSPNRELIHQAIEAFEDHLTNGELSKKNGTGKKKDKMGRRGIAKPSDESEQLKVLSVPDKELPTLPEGSHVPDAEKSYFTPVNNVEAEEVKANTEDNEDGEAEVVTGNPPEDGAAVQVPASNHKGLARKVLPDVLGLFNSRLWSLWSPNV
ncbi:hypothetical protein HHK36_015870 [Tetracentron sinense]|uniref:Uncharacterized protein n=1 Tax=Tetracentron sinense TaxID=13715 RepID=A0A834ZDA0_TETSI|nr:hypothetical protein HHK36_015870 [Tetracentron sinense]